MAITSTQLPDYGVPKSVASTTTTSLEALISSTDNPCPACCGRWLRIERTVDEGGQEVAITQYEAVNGNTFTLYVRPDQTSEINGMITLSVSQTSTLLAWMATCGIVDLGA